MGGLSTASGAGPFLSGQFVPIFRGPAEDRPGIQEVMLWLLTRFPIDFSNVRRAPRTTPPITCATTGLGSPRIGGRIPTR